MSIAIFGPHKPSTAVDKVLWHLHASLLHQIIHIRWSTGPHKIHSLTPLQCTVLICTVLGLESVLWSLRSMPNPSIFMTYRWSFPMITISSELDFWQCSKTSASAKNFPWSVSKGLIRHWGQVWLALAQSYPPLLQDIPKVGPGWCGLVCCLWPGTATSQIYFSQQRKTHGGQHASCAALVQHLMLRLKRESWALHSCVSCWSVLHISFSLVRSFWLILITSFADMRHTCHVMYVRTNFSEEASCMHLTFGSTTHGMYMSTTK